MFSRFTLFTLSALIVCSVDSTAKVVNEETAQNVVKSFMASKGLSADDMVLLPSSQSDPSRVQAQSATTPAYYIFSSTDNNDFVVVSADDIARPILGYSFGSVDADTDMPPAMKEWLDEMERQINYARKSGVAQSAQIASQWLSPERGEVVKQLNTAKWNQRYPYNLQCPKDEGEGCYTGCTSTAYAILMKYYGSPSGGKGITPGYYTSKGIYVPSRDVNHTYDWNSMPLEYKAGEFTDEQANSVSQLMADIGAAIRADYSKDGTNAYNSKGAVFAHFGIHVGNIKKKADYTTDEWKALLKAELDNNRPVLYNGTSEQGSGSHAFIIDGYTDQDYFCVNWGWGGNCDGAYAIDALILDFVDYNSDQRAYTEIHPAGELPAVAVVNDNLESTCLEGAVGLAPFNGQATQIKLVADCTTDEVIVENNQNVILDLNGFNLNVVTYGLFNRGHMTILDSKGGGKVTVTKGNTQIISNSSVLTIEGGEFINMMSIQNGATDYRRCIWSAQGSKTVIRSGKFKCIGQTICTNGDFTIESGDFECTGNNCVIANYSTDGLLVIKDGSYKNSSAKGQGNDYRRAVWTAENTSTQIDGGLFTCDYQVLTFNGNAVINDATVDGKGIGCLSSGEVVIYYSKMSTTRLLAVNTGHSLKCYGGLYSLGLSSNFLGEGCRCIANHDAATCVKYPYKVYNDGTGIEAVMKEADAVDVRYDLNGRVRSDNNAGLQIIRKADGKVIKVLNRE